VIDLIIASTKRGQMRPWLEVLSSQYPVIFTDKIEMILSGEKQYDNSALLVLDARLINETYQLPLLCRYINKVIIVGEKITPSQQIQFIYEGASGYSDKAIDKQLITRTIEAVLNDEIWLKRQYVPQMLKSVVTKQNFTAKKEQLDNNLFANISILTDREIEVIEHVYNGKDNTTIAEQLHITNRTVKAHLSAIFRKLNVPDRFKLVVFLKNLQLGQLAGIDGLF